MTFNRIKHTQSITVALFLLSWGLGVHGQSVSEERPQPVSLIRVIANPEKFDGQRLRIIGVFDYGGGLDQALCLYVSETDARNGVITNCISLDLAHPVDKHDKHLGKYVILNATFRYVSGHTLESLSLQSVSDMKLWGSSDEKSDPKLR